MTRFSTRARSSRRLMVWFGFWACLVILGLGLGLWQWERAADKRDLLARFESAPRLVAPESAPPGGARITVTGEYLQDETLFLDNRIHGERLGVAALTPLRGEDGRLWLVERGFMPMGPSRETPRVSTPTGQVTLQGRWQMAGESAPLFGPNREGKRLQRIDLGAWDMPGGFAHDGWLHLETGKGHLTSWWRPNVLPPSRHIGYAVQWWGLAITALVVMVVGARRWRRDGPEPSPETKETRR
ncbi:SURF1 family protein [Halomonas sp. I1]|uniref:SURF1 family protein n=1 Tax=Halomonas sp. I1 TaxID=393536 RepID=UPI0028DFB7B2|nr:SURF1 family protein [Halomonas sp. I1]MDT8893788.1 SURF1 family protein [Halomonas sp. I1]